MNILDEILRELKAIRAIVDPKPKAKKRKIVCPTLIVVHDKPIAGLPTDGLCVRSRKTLVQLQYFGIKNLSELTERNVRGTRGCGVHAACEIANWAMEMGAKP